MNVLVLSGKQACGPGLPAGKGYLAQLTKRLRGGKQAVQVHHQSVSLPEAGRLLSRLCLTDYDLILLQFDLSVSGLPVTPVGRLLRRGKLWLLGHRGTYWNELRTHLSNILLQVRVFNRRVVLISPLPHAGGLEQQLASLAGAVYAQASTEWEVPLFNVSHHLSGGEELFQSNVCGRLSAVAHELLASELHAFISEPTYTLWS